MSQLLNTSHVDNVPQVVKTTLNPSPQPELIIHPNDAILEGKKKCSPDIIQEVVDDDGVHDTIISEVFEEELIIHPNDAILEEKKKWSPLECSPDIIQEVVGDYGVHDTIISEVFGEELFDMIPQPIEALIVLFPSIPEIKEHINKTFEIDNTYPRSQLWHMNQRIGNACGTFALFHTFLNLRQVGDVVEDSIMDQLLVKMCTLTEEHSLNCAEIFENQPGIETIHTKLAQQGQTDAADFENTQVHYITFICKFDTMWLLDGAKNGPLNCGPCTQDRLLAKAWSVATSLHQIWGKETDFAALAASKLE